MSIRQVETVNFTDFTILRILEHENEIEVSKLYYRFVVYRPISYTAFKNHLRKLDKQGYVKIIIEKRAMQRVRITDDGKKLLDVMREFLTTPK